MRLLAMAGVGLALCLPSGAAAEDHSIEFIVGNSQGNHRLDCRIIRPWPGD